MTKKGKMKPKTEKVRCHCGGVHFWDKDIRRYVCNSCGDQHEIINKEERGD